MAQIYYCEVCKTKRLATVKYIGGYTVATCSKGHVTERETMGYYLPKDDEDVLFFAFRYALGRRTGAVTLLVAQIKRHWKKLRPQTQVQIQEEINGFDKQWGNLGGECDKEAWQEVLDLKPSRQL